MPDLGVATLNDMRENAAMIAGLDQKVPLIADADTGFGGTCNPPITARDAPKLCSCQSKIYHSDVPNQVP